MLGDNKFDLTLDLRTVAQSHLDSYPTLFHQNTANRVGMLVFESFKITNATPGIVNSIEYPEEAVVGESAPTEYTQGKATRLPTDAAHATDSSLSLAGWYTDEALTKPISTISATSIGDIKLYAKWEKNEIVYNTNDGTEIANEYYTPGEQQALSTDTSKDGYTFAGWYDNADFNGKAITNVPVGAKGKFNVYAKWVENDSGENAEG